MSAMGAPEWAAGMTGEILGGAGSQMALNAVSRPVADPEPNQEPNPQLAQYMQLQQMQAAAEHQRYRNQINLAYAKNYSDPTVIIHKNPSQDMDTAYRVLSQKTNYSL
jgi:hypothetical protein